MTDIKRLKGLKALLQDAVEHGASAIERVHLETSKRPFDVLEKVPPIGKPSQSVRAIHDTIVSGVYGSVRVVNRVVGKTLDVALDALDKGEESASAAQSAESAESETSDDADKPNDAAK